MNPPLQRPGGRLACSLFAAVLLCGAAPAALAQTGERDAKLEAMQRQLDEMRAQMEQLRAGRPADPQVAAMQAQLDAFGRQLAAMEAAPPPIQQIPAQASAPKPDGGAVTASLANGRPSLASADGRFTANLRAILNFDTGKYFQDDDLPAATVGRDLNDGTNFRRARFGVDGRLFRDFDYALIYEFGGSGTEDAGRIQEAWAQYTGLKPFRIRVGAFEASAGLAAATSTSQMPLLERPAPAEVARNVAAGDARSGLQLAGNGVFGDKASRGVRWFAAGALTGGVVGDNALDEQTGGVARLALAPFAGKFVEGHLGLNASYARPADMGEAAAVRYAARLRDRPELRVDGTRLVDTGEIDARNARVFGAEAGLSVRNLLLEGEAFRYRLERRQAAAAGLADPEFSGWYVQGAWVLTGEHRAYDPAEARFNAPRLTANFDPSAGTWGAFELASRYSVLDLNSREGQAGQQAAPDAVRGGEQRIWAVGLNWYLNPAIRFMLDWQHVEVDRLNRAGQQVGQDFNALALRSQLTF